MMGRKVPANAIIAGVVMIIGGAAALYAGYLITGNLDSQFNRLVVSQNLTGTEYAEGISNTRGIITGVFGLLGISLFVLGAGLVIRSLSVMGG